MKLRQFHFRLLDVKKPHINCTMNDQSRIRNDLAHTVVYERITVNNCSAQITMAYWQNFSFHDYLICRQMDGHHWPQRPKMTMHMERKFTQQHDGGLATTGEGGEKGEKKSNKKKPHATLSNSNFAIESPGLHCSRYKQSYFYHLKGTSCEGLRDLLSKSKKKCAALWSMSLVSTLMRLPMPANLKIKMAK